MQLIWNYKKINIIKKKLLSLHKINKNDKDR